MNSDCSDNDIIVCKVAPILRGQLAKFYAVAHNPRRLIVVHRYQVNIAEFYHSDTINSLMEKINDSIRSSLKIECKGIVLSIPLKECSSTVFSKMLNMALMQFPDLPAIPRLFFVTEIGIFSVGCCWQEANSVAYIAQMMLTNINKTNIVQFDNIKSSLFDHSNLNFNLPLLGTVAIVTGAGNGLGFAIAKLLREEGADVALLDISANAVKTKAIEIGGFSFECDVTNANMVKDTTDKVVKHFGGIDIVMSNAGAAFQGAMIDVSDTVLTKALALNFWGHHFVARNAVHVMQAQNIGGSLVFNVSKQAVNPGANFGPYGISKAALMAMMRQYAIEHGAAGISANAVNADRIRTGLMTDKMVAERSKARGITPQEYMRGNLLHREVTSLDVAKAFVYLAKTRASTGAVLTVDGGNVAAMMR